MKKVYWLAFRCFARYHIALKLHRFPVLLFLACLLAIPAGGSSDTTLNIIREQVQLTLRDGVKLGATLIRPDLPGRFPALVYRTPYNKDDIESYSEFPYKAARSGYLVFLVDVRGRYTSEGDFRAYQNEKVDGYDVIEQAAQHPLCNGKIGTFGHSYRGIVQWLALSQNPPSLKAASPMMTPVNSHHFFYVGGGFSFTWIDWFMPYILPDKRKRASDRSAPFDEEKAENDWRKVRKQWYDYRPLFELPLLKKYAPEYYDWMKHPDKTEWWDFVSVEKEFNKMNAPVLAVSGWYDAVYGVVGATEGFNRIRKEGGNSAAREKSRMIIGPWNHTWPSIRKREFGDVDFGPSAGMDYDAELLQFFNCQIRDECEPDAPPVKIFVMGENRWRNEQEWPLTRARQTSWYLSRVENAGSLSQSPPGENQPPDRYIFDPKQPVWDVFYENLVPYNQAKIESRKDVLVFTSDVLNADMEVSGEVSAELFVSSSAKDTDFALTLCDVRPDGTSINVTGFDAGYLRMRYRNGFDHQELMNPGEVYKIKIGQMYTSNLFKKGHRIRVHITSSKAPHYDPNPNTGSEIATESKLISAEQSVYHNKQYPSKIILPVVAR